MQLRHLYRVAQNAVRERAKRGSKLAQLVTGEKARSPHWPALEKSFVKAHPTCAACGIDHTAPGAHMNVHHVVPFHIDPLRELDPNNLITLCMAQNECHIRLGHGGNFKAANKNVRADAAEVLANPTRRPEIEARAKANRQYA